MQNSANLSTITKPKRKTLKIVLISIVVIILGIGLWVGLTAFNAIKKITAFSDGNNSLFSFLGDSNKTQLKGESEGRTNILLLGMGGKNHPGGNLTDSMILVSIDWKGKKIAMINIPRDLWVPIAGYGSAKINQAYSHGEQNSKTTGGGGQVASETVSKVFGVPVHYFVSMDFQGFKEIVNTVGGLDINVEKAINDPLYPAPDMIHYDPFSISAGLHHMDGDVALKYARSRETTSDFDRSKRQQQVILAIKKKVISLNILANPKKLTDLMNITGEHIRTNLSVTEIKSLWNSIKDIDTSNIINKVLDTSADGPLTATQDQRGYIIIPRKGVNNFSDLQEMAKNIFGGSTDSSNLKIEVLNGSNKSGVATTAANELKSAGYKVTKIGDATKKYQESLVYNCLGRPASSAAQKIAKMFSASTKTKTDCGLIDIQLILGESFSES